MIYSHPGIPLQNHLREVGETSREIIQSKELNLTIADKNLFAELSYLIGIAHDFGKATSFFQALIAGKDVKKDTHHAPISSLFAYLLAKEITSNGFLPVLAYLAVRYHHSNLKSPCNTFAMAASVAKQLKDLKKNKYEELEEMYRELLPSRIKFSTIFQELESLIKREILTRKFERNVYRTYLHSTRSLEDDQKLELFLCSNFLFSMLIDTDKKAAGNLDTDYFEGATETVIDVGAYIKHEQLENAGKFNPEISINRIRNEFFLRVTENEKLDDDQYLYTITAPTGVGKTFAAFSVANKIKQQLQRPARIIYALPYTSIIDQNYDELEKILKWSLKDEFKKNPTKYLLKHHYLSPMKIERDKADEEKKKIKEYAQYYDDRVLNESWDAGHIVTTFVQLLESMIGYKNRQLKKYQNIANSIIIIDEVQNIPAEYHLLIGKLLRVFAHRFNTYIILMTATQPTIFKEEDTEELADTKKLFNEKGLDRVNVSITENLRPIEIEKFIGSVYKNFTADSILIVCNTKSSAFKVFEQLEEKLKNVKKKNFYCLTTLLTPNARLKQIEDIDQKLKTSETIICVSTQLIEAGVDLSFPVVYRDFGPFDSIVQVAGRCNRNRELEKGKLHLMRLEGEKKDPFQIYDNILLQYSNEVLEGLKGFESKNFLTLGKDYFDKFDMEMESRSFLTGIQKLNYSQDDKEQEKAVCEFKLIDEKQNQIELIICTNPEVEQNINQLMENRNRFKESGPYTEERKILMGEGLELKQKLANYTIRVYEHQLVDYLESAEIMERFDGKLKFVPYEFCRQGNVYDQKTGFNTNPKTVTKFKSF